MVALGVIVIIILFITADALVRLGMERRRAALERRERAKALDAGLRLEFADEAKSLKRVELDNPRARILALDDEEIVLDSLRKILVLAGYAIDTVQSGPEALSLLKSRGYDFFFTDLRMPGMDGVEVCKAAKHLRPDVDTVIITGFASVESAVATMKYGASDYVQKPFAEDELIEFVKKLVIRREERLARETKPKLHLVTPASTESASPHVFNLPAGVFISSGHTWARLELNGSMSIGLDDFALKIMGAPDQVLLSEQDAKIARGERLCSVRKNGRSLDVASPLTGRIIAMNTALRDNPGLMALKPYEEGWICRVEAADLSKELQGLRLGADAVSWYQSEIDRCYEARRSGSESETLDDREWQLLCSSFLACRN